MVTGVSCTAWASWAISMAVVRVKRLAVAAIRKKRMFKSPGDLAPRPKAYGRPSGSPFSAAVAGWPGFFGGADGSSHRVFGRRAGAVLPAGVRRPEGPRHRQEI